MNIVKYKRLVNGRYKISFDNSQEIILYEDVILKYELLLKKHILESTLEEIELENQKWDIYYTALKTLNARFKSRKEVYEFLIRKEYDRNLIDEVLNKLVEQGYINDRSFSKSYINNQILTTSKGPNKIFKELLSKGVGNDIIEEELITFSTDIQEERINKLINKYIKVNKTRSGNVLKLKIVNDLINLGYDSYIVKKIITDYSFSCAKEIVDKEYAKLYKRYSKKYSGKELEYKIKQSLYQKGFNYEE